VPSRIAAELRAKKERRRATANARPGAGTQLLLTAAGGTSARAIPPPTDPWSGEPPYVKTAEEKRIDHYATKQLRVARRFATLLQLKTMDMVDRAREIVASLEELRIPDAGGDEWMDYVESREVRAESAAGERDGERDAEHADLARWRRERRSPARLAPADGGEDGVELRSLTTEAEHPHHPDRVERGADAGAEPGAADARRPSQPSFAMPNVGASEGGRERWRSSFSSRGSNDEERASLTPRAIRHRNADALTRDVDDSDMAAGDEDDETQAAQTDARESDNEEEWERGGVASAPRSKWRTARLQMSATAAVAAPVTERRIERILREQKVRVFCCVGAAQRTLGLSLSFPLFSLFPPRFSLSLLHSRSHFGVSPPPPPSFYRPPLPYHTSAVRPRRAQERLAQEAADVNARAENASDSSRRDFGGSPQSPVHSAWSGASSVEDSEDDPIVAAALAHGSDDHWMDHSSSDEGGGGANGSRGLTTRLRQATRAQKRSPGAISDSDSIRSSPSPTHRDSVVEHELSDTVDDDDLL
jgi:hypothetical protein